MEYAMGYVFGCFWEIIDLQYPVAMETQFMEAFLDVSGHENHFLRVRHSTQKTFVSRTLW